MRENETHNACTRRRAPTTLSTIPSINQVITLTRNHTLAENAAPFVDSISLEAQHAFLFLELLLDAQPHNCVLYCEDAAYGPTRLRGLHRRSLALRTWLQVVLWFPVR